MNRAPRVHSHKKALCGATLLELLIVLVVLAFVFPAIWMAASWFVNAMHARVATQDLLLIVQNIRTIYADRGISGDDTLTATLEKTHVFPFDMNDIGNPHSFTGATVGHPWGYKDLDGGAGYYASVRVIPDDCTGNNRDHGASIDIPQQCFDVVFGLVPTAGCLQLLTTYIPVGSGLVGVWTGKSALMPLPLSEQVAQGLCQQSATIYGFGITSEGKFIPNQVNEIGWVFKIKG